MRILFVTNRFPGQLVHGDQVRAYHQIRCLAGRHAITLLSFGEVPEDSRWRVEMAACCERVIAVRRHPFGVALRAVAALGSRLPLQVAMYDAVPAVVGLDALLAAARFDLAHVQLARLGPMLRRLSPLPCVVDFIDALSLNMARRAAFDRAPVSWVARMESSRLERYERKICAEAAATAISSAQDRAAVGNFRNLHVVGNGVDLDQFPFVVPRDRGANVVFIGNLGYFPNVDAASRFALEVMPQLAARVPAARFTLVGARPAPVLRSIAARQHNVDLVGRVSDIHPYLADAAVAVVPLRAGSGQQLKILEAMAAGTPVVATTLSAAGLQAVDGEHLLIADGADAMADAIARLMSEGGLRERLARQARALIETRYTWKQSALDLERVWLAAAGTASR